MKVFERLWTAANSYRFMLKNSRIFRKDRDMSEDTAMQKRQKEESAVKEMLSWVITIALAVVAALFIKNYVIINANIPSGSMENTIMTNDRLFGNRLAYRSKTPERGDIIIFKFPDNENENYVKRVVGLPGETVEIKDAKIYIDGSDMPLEENYLKEAWTVAAGPYHFEVPQGCYLVLGDNRNNSWDSRYWENTFVAEEKILGKAVFRYYPIQKAGSLY